MTDQPTPRKKKTKKMEECQFNNARARVLNRIKEKFELPEFGTEVRRHFSPHFGNLDGHQIN